MKITRRLENLRRTEHSSTVDIVSALVICEREKAYLEQGHSSLWVYLVEGLKYSQAAASRRYRAAKCASKFPQVIGMLRDHRVSLSSLSKVEALLGKVEDPAGLLERICGKSHVQVERIVAEECPGQRRPRESMTRKFVKLGGSSKGPVRPGSSENLFHTESHRVAAAAPKTLPEAISMPIGTTASPALQSCRATSAAEVELPTARIVEERVVLRTSLTADRFDALERARAIYSRKNPGATVEELLNELVDHYLAAKAPKVRTVKRVRKTANDTADKTTSKAPSKAPDAAASDPRTPASRSRHIPAAIRDEVMLRDGQRCTFRSASGRRCAATQNLQLDHIRPFALGGDHSPDNLRVLCAAHNRYEAEKVFGKRRPPQRRSMP